MGAYLTKPITEKFSSDEANEFIDVGASSMQGWRISQEDAHNCILDFDENTSFFAVYDGHGGAEVATYCAENFPEFLKNLKAYKEGNYEQALKDAFLGFDKTLLQEDVIEILKKLAGERNPDRDSELAEEEEEEDLAQLCQEGSLPLDEVLEKYKTTKSQEAANKQTDDEAVASSSGTSKSLSRSMRGRRNLVELDLPSCSSDVVMSNQQTETDDIVVSSSNTENENSTTNTTTVTPTSAGEICKSTIPKENGDGLECVSSDSEMSSKDISVKNSEKLKNGDIKSHGENIGRNEGVSSTSSSPSGSSRPQKFENGGITGNHSIKDFSENSMVGCQIDDDESSSEEEEEEEDIDFHAEENSSTEDGEEDCEPCDEETEEEVEEEEEEEEEDDGWDDTFCANMIEEPGKDSGCTAVIALLQGKDLYVANAGDSRCVLCRGGTFIEMSLDHKPEDEKEKHRIYNAGGKVTLDGRVNGGLNLSRAIGDHAYKMNKDLPPEEQMISALPDIKKISITPEDEFMILACDGIWNYMSSEDVVEFIKKRLDEGRDSTSQICEELFDNCLAPHTIGDGTGCDNMTAVIVRFKQPKILELPTNLSDKCEIESIDVLSNKRSASSMSDNENDIVNKNTSKRVKTEDHKEKDDSLLSSSEVSIPPEVEISENISSTVTSTSTLPTAPTTITPAVTNQNDQDSLVASTT